MNIADEVNLAEGVQEANRILHSQKKKRRVVEGRGAPAAVRQASAGTSSVTVSS